MPVGKETTGIEPEPPPVKDRQSKLARPPYCVRDVADHGFGHKHEDELIATPLQL
jgi:hypothetical protein